jgi:hypothetical protein
MNRHRIDISPQQIENRIRRRRNKLSDERFNFIGSKCDPLVGCIQESYGISEDEAERLLEHSIWN